MSNQHTDSNEYFNALPTGYVLEQYKVTKVLGAGGFGIAYLANDMRLDTQVVLKEYLPNDISVRESSTSRVLAKDTSSQQDYEWGLEQYITEARTIAKFDHPNIVQVKNYIEANNTAYIVMNYVEGSNLSQLAKGETATEEEIYRIILPLLDGLKIIHDAGYLHRDIKPSNIFIQDDSRKPVLIDFGAARYLLGNKSKSITSVVTPGYSPYEQYHSKGKNGPWTDIYAMGGVIYRLISGETPEESVARLNITMEGEPDPLIPATQLGKGKYSLHLLQAVDHALALRESQRPRTIGEWLEELAGEKEVTLQTVVTTNQNQVNNQKPQVVDKKTDTENHKPSSSSKKMIGIGMIGLLLLGGVVGGYFWQKSNSYQNKVVTVNSETISPVDMIESPEIGSPPTTEDHTGAPPVNTPSAVELNTENPAIGTKEIPTEKQIANYIDHGDGTVTDINTNLMWKKCSEGQSGDDCSGDEVKFYQWDDAMQRFKSVSFAGYDDWRMPTVEELKSLVYCSNGTPQDEAWNEGCSDNSKYIEPKIRQDVFPNVGLYNLWYWSVSQHDTNSGDARFVLFLNGRVGNIYKGRSYRIRLVRNEHAAGKITMPEDTMDISNTSDSKKEPSPNKSHKSKESRYVIQPLATSNKSKAYSLKSTFAREGYPAYVSVAKRGGKTLYRVRIGSYQSKSKAIKKQSAMKRRYRKNAYIQSSIVVRN